jgi:adenine-specific DNA-methyltransferase
VIENVFDYLLWYARDKEALKYRNIFMEKPLEADGEFKFIEVEDGKYRELKPEERMELSKHAQLDLIFKRSVLESSGFTKSCTFRFEFEGRPFDPRGGKSWRTNPEGIETLKRANRLFILGSKVYYKLYYRDFPYMSLTNGWADTMAGYAEPKRFVVQTHPKVIRRCMLMTTDPGDLVLDPTCGSGTTAYVAEQWGRRWITCDTSRVAVTLAKQRLMTAEFDYYDLAHPDEGVGSGFHYKSVPHVTLKSIANNPEIREGMTRDQIDMAIARNADQESLYDQPYIDKSRVRVTGPFTVEAVPAPTVRSLDDIEVGSPEAQSASGKAQQSLADFRHAATPLLDASVSRSGATLRHTEWRDELLKTGLRGKGGHHIDFSRVEPLAGTRWLHADAETKGAKPERVVISFGPEHSLLDPRQVESAWQEARTLIPRPAMIVFAAFEFDPQAAKEIDELTKEKTGMTFLSAQMNADMLTEDLKKKRASNQSFWLVGRPDVDLRQIAKGDHKGKWEVEVQGFDYYNTRTGTIDSGDTSKIAMWLLDTDYDGRSLYPRQVFFPIADADGGWARLAKNLKAEIDPDLIEVYRGTISLPFEPGEYKRIAVKVIDDRGIESLKVVEVK